MNAATVQEILIYYAGLVLLLTVYEVGHAWMAWKSGDPTVKDLPRTFP